MRSPLLGKGGVAAPSSKWSRSFEGAAGVVRSTSDNRWLEPTILPCFALSGSHSLRSCPSAPAKEASRHSLNGRSHPSLSKEGTSASLQLSSMPPCSAKDVGHSKGKGGVAAPSIVLVFEPTTPPRPSLEREFFLMARPPLLCQGWSPESGPPLPGRGVTR